LNVLEIRLEILKAEGLGFNQAEAVKTISEKYDVPKSVLWYHYRTKPKWQPHFQGIDTEKLRLTILNRYEYCYRESSFILHTTLNENVKLGALSRMIETLHGQSDLLGPQKVELTQTEPFKVIMWRPEKNADTPKTRE
jgi:hypothetical protein